MESPAPALDGGLTLLECLADHPEGRSFSELVAAVPQSKATVIRLLKVLTARNFIAKCPETGQYHLGLRSATLSHRFPLAETFARRARPHLERLCEATDNTTIAFHWDGRAVEALGKCTHPLSLAMQEPGERQTDLSLNPWGWLFLQEMATALDRPPRAVARAQGWRLPIRPEYYLFYEKHGFAYDDQTMRRDCRRLAAPLMDNEGRLLGALAVGGTLHSLPDRKVMRFGHLLRQEAANLGRALQGGPG